MNHEIANMGLGHVGERGHVNYLHWTHENYVMA